MSEIPSIKAEVGPGGAKFLESSNSRTRRTLTKQMTIQSNRTEAGKLEFNVRPSAAGFRHARMILNDGHDMDL